MDERELTPEEFDQLLKEARAGSREALGKILEACRGYLLWIGLLRLPRELRPVVGGSDLIQDVLVKALQDFVRFRGSTQGELLAWLRGMLKNALRAYRHQYHMMAASDVGREVPLDEPDRIDWIRKRLLEDLDSLARQTIWKEEERELQLALERMPDVYREVVRLRATMALPFEEIGFLLKRSPEAARKLWTRAVEWLQNELTPAPDAAKKAAGPAK